MRWFRIAGAAALLSAVLGCGGMGSMLPTGGIQTGADAVRPADFPMPEPPGGTLATSASLVVAGVRTTSVQYTMEAANDAELLDMYEKSMKDAGLETQRIDHPESPTLTGTFSGETSVWTATLGHESGLRTVTLVVIER